MKPNVTLVSQSKDFRSVFVRYITSGDEYYRKYTSLILLGLKNEGNKDIYESAINNNFVHLFVVSGFHIGLFYLIIEKIFSKAKKYGFVISLIILLFYLYLLDFSLSSVRAFIFIFISRGLKIFYKKKIDNFVSLSITMALIMLIFPRQINSLSFKYVFIASYSLVIASKVQVRSKLSKFIVLNLGVYLSTIFMSISVNEHFAVLGIFNSIILSPIFSFIFGVTLFLFWAKPLMDIVYMDLDFLLSLVDDVSILINISLKRTYLLIIYNLIVNCFIIYLYEIYLRKWEILKWERALKIH